MRNQLLIGGGMCFAAVVLIFAGSARAEPPPSMTYTEISVPIVACDTRDEMGTIVQAVKNGMLAQALAQFAKVKDENGEPVCLYSKIGPVVFGDSEHLGRIKDHQLTVDAWVSNVGNSRAGFYVLWGELVPETGT